MLSTAAVALLLLAPARPDAGPAQPKALSAPPGGAAVARESQPSHVILDGKGAARILLDEHTAPGLKEAALTELLVLPGASIAEHSHDTSAELIYVLEGKATMTLGDKTIAIAPGMAIYIPAGVKHSLKLDNPVEPLRAIQVYTPGGPEQRFRAGPTVRE